MIIKKGDFVELQVTDLAFEGKGIAKVKQNDDGKDFILFIEGAYPGDTVSAQITKKKSNYAEAKTTAIKNPSPNRIEPRCKFFGICGGCKQQSLNYSTQLFYKQKQVVETIQKIGGLKDFEIEEIVSSQNIYYYRNKLEFSFSDKRWLTKEEILSGDFQQSNFALGFHIPKIYDKVLDIDECFLQSDLSNRILNFTRNFFLSENSTAYSTKTHVGFLRNLVVRQAAVTKEIMVNLVTSTEDNDLLKKYSSALISAFPEITTIVNNISQKLSQVAYGDYEKVFFGKGFIHEFIGDFKFRISANSFFQTNTTQAERLYESIVNFSEFNGKEVVYDLFSGAGTISLYISKLVKEVFAFESSESAIKDAEINSSINSVDNVFHVHHDLNKSFLDAAKNFPKPDIIITDPPRNGMHQNTINDILNLLPEKIIYVSCNPATQARDLKLLCENKYELIKIKPHDLFPHTFHIENVALLKRIN